MLCLALQLALTADVEMPDDVVSSGQARAILPSISGQFLPPILLENSIFSPGRTANIATGDTAQAPLGGAILAGAVSIRGRSYAVLQSPDRRVVRLAIGATYQGWRLRALTPMGAIFEQGSQKLDVNFGAGAIQNPPQSAEYEEEQ